MSSKIRKYYLSLLLLLPALCSGQTYWKHLQQNRLSYGLMFTGGAANGISDALQHKYGQTVFPKGEEELFGLDRSFYDPNISWKRKYKNWPEDTRPRYPGAKTWLAWTTDAWHLSKTVQLKSMQLAVVTYSPPRQGNKWWWAVADVAIQSLCFSAGFHLSQHLIIK
jgi:hypothetical protein